MNIEEFIIHFSEQFDNPEKMNLTPDTKYRECEDWNSLTAMMTQTMADEVYGVVLPPEKLRETQTIQELYDLIVSLKY